MTSLTVSILSAVNTVNPVNTVNTVNPVKRTTALRRSCCLHKLGDCPRVFATGIMASNGGIKWRAWTAAPRAKSPNLDIQIFDLEKI